MKLAKTHMREETAVKKRKLDLQERELHLCEFELGLITKEEYLQQMVTEKERTPEPPSSDWDYEKLENDMEGSGA